MGTIRHETVHYTVKEMEAKEIAEAVKTAKELKRRLIIGGISTAVMLFGCLVCLIAGVLGNGG